MSIEERVQACSTCGSLAVTTVLAGQGRWFPPLSKLVSTSRIDALTRARAMTLHIRPFASRCALHTPNLSAPLMRLVDVNVHPPPEDAGLLPTIATLHLPPWPRVPHVLRLTSPVNPGDPRRRLLSPFDGVFLDPLRDHPSAR